MQNKVNIIRQIKLKIYTLLSCHSEQSEESPLLVILSKAKNLLTHLLHPLERYVPSRTKRTWHKLPKLARRLVVLLLILAIVTPFYLFGPWNRPTEAAWFDENWAYRQAIPVTSTEGSAQSNVFISFTLDTATLITAGKMSSSCQDLRITDQGGKLLKYHLARVTACNNAATTVDFLLTSFPDGKSTYYVYYGNPSVSTADAGSLTVSQASSATVTASGNEITDTTRTTNTQGDGVTPPDSSYGIWQAATNLVTNGGFETNTTGWAAEQGSIARDITQSKFGSASMKLTSGGVQYAIAEYPITLVNGTTYTFSVWVNRTEITDDWRLDFNNEAGNTMIPKVLGWQRVILTRVSTGTAIFFRVINYSTSSSIIYIDGVQFETGSIATPYIETNGGTASRAAGRIQGNSSVLNATQGWIAFRAKPGWATSALPASGTRLFMWYDGTSNNVFEFSFTTNELDFRRRDISGDNYLPNAVSLSANTNNTYIAKWTATQIGSSVNGASFTTQSNTKLPTGLPATFDIGSQPSTSLQFDGNFLWAAAGTGTLTDADAATINGYGNTDPTTTQLATLNGGLGIPTFLWTADTTADTQTTYSQSAARNYTIGTLATEEKSPAPVAYWKFDDGTGTAAYDSTSNGLNGTLNNTPTWKTEDQCITGKCLFFDGTSNENVSRADNAKLDFVAADNFTIGAWVKRNGASSANNFIITKAQTGYTGYKLYQDASGDYCFDVSDGTNTDTACTSAVDFDDNNWHLVQGVKSATTSITLYVDGKQRAQDASIAATGTLANTGTFYAGVDLDGISNEWLGFIDDVKIYSYARTAAQVKADYAARGTSKGSAATLSGVEGSNLSNGLVGYWKMDESSWTNDCTATSVTDFSGNGGNGKSCPSTTGPAGGALGKFGNSGTFSGSNYVKVANSTALQVANNEFTLAAWIYPTNTQEGGIITKRTTNSDTNYILNYSSSGIFFNYRMVSGWYTSANYGTISQNTWTHVAFAFNLAARTVKFYVNGILVGAETITEAPLTISSEDLTIGADIGYPRYFIGSIDETRIYNRALSGAEVSQLYNWAPGPVGYWNFEEGQGSSVSDTSGNANTGTWAGTATHWTSGKFGKAGNFSTSADYVNVGSSSVLAPSNTVTVEAWAYPTAIPNSENVLVARYYTSGDSTTDWMLEAQSNGTWRFLIQQSNLTLKTISAGTATLNAWNHVVGVADGSYVRLYVNGVAVGTPTAYDGTLAQGSRSVTIGRNRTEDTNGAFTGRIDEVKIYNYARTAKQIVSDMNAGHPNVGSPVGSALGHWKFDEGALNKCSGGTNDYCDSSINANDLAFSTTTGGYTDSGKFGKALNGTGAVWATRADDADFDFSETEDLSVSLWYKSDSATNPSAVEYLFNKASATIAGYAVYANTSGNLCFGIDDDTIWGPNVASCTTTDVYDGTWHYLTAVRNVTLDKTYIYIDGQQKDSDTDSTTATLANSLSLYVADRDGVDNGDEFSGDLDDVKVYRYALTADEVKTDMNRGSSQVLGAAGDNSTYAINAANQEYCIPGDTTSCASPVGRWDFNERQGTTTNDMSGNAHTGTLLGSSLPVWTNGKVGSALKYNGSTSYVSLSGTDYGITSNQATVEHWIYPTAISGPTQLISDSIYSPQTGGWQIYVNSSSLKCFSSDGTGYSANSFTYTFNNNTWYHIVCAFNGATTKAYVNGVLIDSSTNTHPIINPNQVLYVGAGNNAGAPAAFFTGSIDNIRIFNYARSAAQVAWDYNRGAPVGHWKMDECQGSTANDSSGNANTGTITIGATGTQTSVGTCTAVDTATAWYNGRTGKYNSSLNFDGTDDYISVSDNNSLDVGDIFTLSAWVKRGATGAVHQILNRGANGTFILAFIANDKLELGSHNVATIVNSTTTITDTTTWHHLVATKNGSTVKLYIDGRDVTGTVTDSTTGNTTNSLYIGRNSDGAGSQFFNGQIDDVRIYNYALTATQIKQVFNQGSAVRFGPSTGSP